MGGFTRISVQKARELMDSSEITIVDIRDPGSFAQGHIPNAKAVNEGNIESFLGKTDKTKPLICYCYHGNSSQGAASFFAAQGFKEVYSLDGGWEGWRMVDA